MYDLKEKIKNPVFLFQIGVAFFAPVLAYAGLTGADLTSWSAIAGLIMDTVSNPYALFLGVTGLWTALTNPNTPGLGD